MVGVLRRTTDLIPMIDHLETQHLIKTLIDFVLIYKIFHTQCLFVPVFLLFCNWHVFSAL